MSHDPLPSEFVVNEVELVYRRKAPIGQAVVVNSSKIAFQLLHKAWNADRIDLLEEFKILLLDNKSSCLGISHLSTGGMNHCLVDPKIVFATALKAAAKEIILAHNHPSGNLKPSAEDIALTQRMVNAGRVLDIKIVDHLIMTSEGYTSFSDDGLMP